MQVMSPARRWPDGLLVSARMSSHPIKEWSESLNRPSARAWQPADAAAWLMSSTASRQPVAGSRRAQGRPGCYSQNQPCVNSTLTRTSVASSASPPTGGHGIVGGVAASQRVDLNIIDIGA